MVELQAEVNEFGQIVDGHLGGYVPGGDPNTQYPILWDWLIEHEQVGCVLDVGCGDGMGALSHFRIHGCAVTGIDGIPQDDPDILSHDYTYGHCVSGTKFDLVWCCEFVEHVEEEHVPNFLHDFKAAPLVLMTHATPGQGGHHHVNEQEAPYWIGVMAGIGYQCDLELTIRCRELAGAEPIHPNMNYFQKTGLAFRRRP